MSRTVRRKLLSGIVVGLCGLAVVLALIPLFLILVWVLRQGIGSLDWAFFTQVPKPVGEPGGGMANAILGSITLVLLAAGMAVPVGVLTAVHLSEYPRTRFSTLVRFLVDVLNGVPSIVVGIFAYAVVVLPVKHFSAWAGGVALAVLMLPLVTRTAEELLLLVPGTLREGALALGASRARAVLTVILPAALPGIMTGVLVSLARVAGEAAPLLFTAFGNRYWSKSLSQPMASLTVQVYTYAISPYEDWHRQAWAGALVLVALVSLFSILSRIVTARLERMHHA
ncbi:MAG TPA: phosphate ABC transporter permease PstA [Thermoanaerobaculia bacterium]|jgi:phosphate transport system permease protein|nr:phosphate ABC transporter permease PstA [Thermoanaerobaculia bacterium]